ncbi:hypothetical protein ACFQ36_02960 [Arthrobacter sp. GCM10027362]|uniref:hypothetical protein n=1 Tax=Arthrobacter sp. GCM10027362 TaxID=3273379 RepID=UPI00362F7B59
MKDLLYASLTALIAALTVLIVAFSFCMVWVSVAITAGEPVTALSRLGLAAVLFLAAIGTAKVLEKHQPEEAGQAERTVPRQGRAFAMQQEPPVPL